MRRRSVLVASAATLVFFGAVWFFTVTSPGWPTVKATFFSVDDAKASFPSIWHAFCIRGASMADRVDPGRA